MKTKKQKVVKEKKQVVEIHIYVHQANQNVTYTPQYYVTSTSSPNPNQGAS